MDEKRVTCCTYTHSGGAHNLFVSGCVGYLFCIFVLSLWTVTKCHYVTEIVLMNSHSFAGTHLLIKHCNRLLEQLISFVALLETGITVFEIGFF